MAHIAIEEGIPGILGPMKFRPETTEPLRELAEVLLRGDNSLTQPSARRSRHLSRRATTVVSASSPTVLRRPSTWAETRSTTHSSIR